MMDTPKFREVFGYKVDEDCLCEILTLLNKYGYNRLLASMAYCTALFIVEVETNEEKLMWHQFMGTLAGMIDTVPIKYIGGTIDGTQYTGNWYDQCSEEMVEGSQCDGSGI